MPARSRMTKNNVADGPRIARNKIDDARRQARFFENPGHLIVAVDGAARALPDDRIAHQRRAEGRLLAMAVKLNGVTAKTNPSSGR